MIATILMIIKFILISLLLICTYYIKILKEIIQMSKIIGRGNQLYRGYGSPYSQANSNNHINNKKAYY